MQTCKGKVAIVTGGAGNGMGRSIALTLGREGANVIVNYRSSERAASAVADGIRELGGQALAVQADVFTQAGCRRLVDAARGEFGQVDICVIGPGGGWHPEAVENLAPEHALEDLQHEVAPVVNLMPLVLPGMYTRNWGRIIAIAQHPQMRSPAYAYNLGKAARTQALLLAQDEAWKHGVTVNVIAPGPVGHVAELETALAHCRRAEAWEARSNVTPQDIAEGVSFLCSPAGRFVSGCVLPYSFN